MVLTLTGKRAFCITVTQMESRQYLFVCMREDYA